MLYNVLYDGPKIDEILGYAPHIKAVLNGWIKLNSTTELPTDFNKLINPGNYNTAYWINGPDFDGFISPLHAIITLEDNIIRQYVFSTGYNVDAWYRIYNRSDSTFTEWRNYKTEHNIYISENTPDNPSNFMLWLNPNNKDAVLQYYDETIGEWIKVHPDDFMDPSIYNPEDINFQDVYQYIDNKLSNLSGDGNQVDYASHINNDTIHVTQSDKDLFNSKMTSDLLDDLMDDLLSDMLDYVVTHSSGTITEVPEIVNTVKDLSDSFKEHTDDTTIHPSQSQIDEWNSKSDKDHIHTGDQIKIDATDVVDGVLDPSNFPDDVKERQVTVTTEDELLALTVNEVQNGDFILINYSDTKNELLIVVDQAKLGTRDAFIPYNEIAKDVSWDMIEDKPTKITDLGITDLMLNENVDNLQNKTENLLNETSETVDNANAIYENCKYQYIKDTCHLESEIDDTDFKLNYLYDYIRLPDKILTTLENMTE